MTHDEVPGYPIAPGCEIAEEFCPDSCHCAYRTYCATHQAEGCDDWPCVPQTEYEESPEAQVLLLREKLDLTAANYEALKAGHNMLAKDHARLTRIVEQALVPFMRDVLTNPTGAWRRTLQIDAHVGDAPSLLGLDIRDGLVVFNRGHMPGTEHGITYGGADGRLWIEGVNTPVRPGPARKVTRRNKIGKRK